MVNFNEGEGKLIQAFNISKEDEKYLEMFSHALEKQTKTIPWVCRRIWIDEHMTDNAKCFAVFMLGRYFEIQKEGRDK